jgi:hypothetical protein
MVALWLLAFTSLYVQGLFFHLSSWGSAYTFSQGVSEATLPHHYHKVMQYLCILLLHWATAGAALALSLHSNIFISFSITLLYFLSVGEVKQNNGVGSRNFINLKWVDSWCNF